MRAVRAASVLCSLPVEARWPRTRQHHQLERHLSQGACIVNHPGPESSHLAMRAPEGALLVALALLSVAAAERPVTEVTLAGEGKLGLAFAKKRTPLTLKHVAPGTLAAAFPELVPGMQLLQVGDHAAAALPYAEAVALLR